MTQALYAHMNNNNKKKTSSLISMGWLDHQNNWGQVAALNSQVDIIFIKSSKVGMAAKKMWSSESYELLTDCDILGTQMCSLTCIIRRNQESRSSGGGISCSNKNNCSLPTFQFWVSWLILNFWLKRRQASERKDSTMPLQRDSFSPSQRDV
jgi:hypothetical protein